MTEIELASAGEEIVVSLGRDFAEVAHVWRV